jgi:hypothetical protein
MKAKTSTKILLAMSVLAFVPLIVAWKWPWEFSWSGTWTGHGKMTVCGKESAKSLDVSFNLNPSGTETFSVQAT